MKKLSIFILVALSVLSATAFAKSNIFADQDTFAAWYEEAAINMYNEGIIKGYKDGNFGASNNVSRAEMAVMMDRLYSKLTSTTERTIDESIIPLCIENLILQEERSFVTGEIMVRVHAAYTEDDVKSFLDDYGLKLVEEDDKIPYGIEYVSVPANKELEWVCRLSQDDRFEWVEKREVYAYGADL